MMERYNLLLYAEKGSEGALVIASDAYPKIIQNRPDFTHENF